jgi:DNA repair protein RecO (recombination protein O)
MALIETEALILRTYGLAEADKIVVFLTQFQGLVRGVAKGAKRLKSKFGGSLEPFSVVRLEYFQKEERELVSIRQIELERSYFDNAADPLFLQNFAYLAELLSEFAPPHEPNENLFRMAKACLEAAADLPANYEAIALYFELWILRLGGYLPNWKICDACRRELNDDEPTNLQANFQMLCGDCQKTRGYWSISAAQRNIFMAAQRLAPRRFAELAAGDLSDIKEISGILKKIITGVLGKEVKSGATVISKAETRP